MKKIFAIILSFGLIIAPVKPVHASAQETAMYAKMVLGIATGLVGTTIIQKCQQGMSQPSVIAFMIGSIAYIGNDVFEALERAFKHQDEAKEYTAVDQPIPGTEENLSQEQIQAQMDARRNQQIDGLQKQKDDEDRNVKTLNRKFIISTAIATVYTIAAIITAFEAWLSLPTPAGAGKDGSAQCSGNNDATLKAVGKALQTAYALSGLLQSAGHAVSAVAEKNWMSLGTLALSATMQFKTFNQLMDAGASAANKTAKLLTNVWVRIGVFGAFATLAWLIVAGVAEEREKAKQRSADIQKQIDNMPRETLPGFSGVTGGSDGGASTAGAAGGATAGNSGGPKKPIVKQLPKYSIPKTCWTQGRGGSAEMTQSGCNKPLSIKIPSFALPGGMKLPVLDQGIGLANELGKHAASGDMEKFDTTAGKLGAMASSVNAMKDDVLEKLNTARKSVGEKAKDFKKEENAILASLQKDYKSNSDAQGLTITETKNGDAKISAPVADPAATPVVTTSEPTEAVAVPETTPSTTEETPMEDVAASSGGQGQDLNEFESSEQDVAKTPEVSIFKQLSNRYILNYTKIFERKKAAEPVEEVPKN